MILSGKSEVINKKKNVYFLANGDVAGKISFLKLVFRAACVMVGAEDVYVLR